MFRFKGFTIEDDRSSMKVGTDGVLLGAWTKIDGSEQRILDIGTGSGLIALMMAQRSKSTIIDAVEIDKNSADQAADNFASSEWSERLQIFHTDIKSFEETEKYDLIVSNPPFFVDSLLSLNSSRTVARHTTELSFPELINAVVRLLKPGGRYAMILPPMESQLFDCESVGRLSLVRRCEVHGRVDLPVKRYLSEYVVGDAQSKLICENLVIEGEKRSDYTSEYRELTADFYLKF